MQSEYMEILMSNPEQIHVRYNLDAFIDANCDDVAPIGQRMNGALAQAILSGAIDGLSLVVVSEQSTNLHVLSPRAAALHEEQIFNWISRQIEDGHMDLESLPALMARYALGDPAQMREEFAERMTVSADQEQTALIRQAHR